MKVLIADDHDIVRAGLRGILSTYDPIQNIHEVSNGKEAIEFIMEEKPDLVILDISMPKLSGLEVLTRMRERGIESAVLILSMYPEKQYAIRALKSGASGYLTKERASDELLPAIEFIASGRKYVSRELQDILFELTTNPKAASPHQNLSDREFKVFTMLAEGKSVQEISTILFISAKTVSTYKSRVFEKLNLSNLAELTRYAIKNDLVD